jgi:tetratricopeptide (TPR) repeat protein
MSCPCICLNMIVKNESAIITRLFDSILPLIDSYVICDTGSTDNTPDLIRNYFILHGIPGKVIEEPFQNFGYNRTHALKQCVGAEKADYLLLMDADMKIEYSKNFDVKKFKAYVSRYDAHYVQQGSNAFYYKNIRIVRNTVGLSYWGVTHEYMELPRTTKYGFFVKGDIFICDIGDGGSKSDKYERDIRLLTSALDDKPDNARYTFYLANSYRDSFKHKKAIETYHKRIKLGGWEEEIWYSKYSIGNIYMKMNDVKSAIYYLLSACSNHPLRIENIYEIVKHYRVNGENELAYMFYKLADEKRQKIKHWDFLFLEKDVYDFKLDYELSILGYYCKDIKCDYVKLCMKLLEYSISDVHIYKNVISNYKFYAPKIDYIHEDKYKVLSSVGENLVDKEQFHGSTPSICWHDNCIFINRRFVNYVIDDIGAYINKTNITTINVIAGFSTDNDNLIQTYKENQLHYDTMKDGLYVGLEDVRLLSLGGILLYTANRGINDLMMVEHGEINMTHGENPTTLNEALLKKTGQSGIEKNWVLFTDIHNKKRCIYSWFPLIIGSLSSGRFLNTHEMTMPNSLRNVRGSTNGVIIGNEIWFICHMVSCEKRRYYYHIMIVLDRLSFKLKRYTPYFTFNGEPVEYTLGFIFKDEQFIIGYSTMDRTTQFITVEKEWFSKMFAKLDFDKKIEDENEIITISM